MNDVTPDQARSALDEVGRALPATAASRRVHAQALVGMGLLMGAYVVGRDLLADHVNNAVTYGLYAVGFTAVYLWSRRAARVLPRGVRLLTNVGTLGSGVLALAGITLTLARQAEARHDGVALTHPWWLSLALLLVIALPCLVAARAIARGDR